MTSKGETFNNDDEENNEYIPTLKEKFLQNQLQIPKWTIRYNDNIRMKWDILIILFALYNCVLIPFDVAFEPNMPRELLNFEKIVDIMFGLDIIVAFKTTYIDSSSGLEVFESRKIALNYIITGRFFIDLAASIPFEDIYMYFATNLEDNEENLELKLFGLLKLIRLLRLGRIIRYLRFKQGLKVGIRMF